MIPTRIGQTIEGGYFAGVIRVKDCAYLILASPKSTEGSAQFKTNYSRTPGIYRVNDGWANTNAMNDVEHPAAQYCRNLNVSGHTDLYLPSRDELELCYRNLKPTDCSNTTYPAGTLHCNLRLATGANRSSIPTGAAYTATNPTQTIVTAFQKGNVEAFTLDWYWSSTDSFTGTNNSLIQAFSSGYQYLGRKTNVHRVSSVRRVLILLNDENHNDTN